MQLTPSERSLQIKDQVVDFMDKHVYPMNKHYHEIANSDRRNDPDALAFIDDLKWQAKELGLWNLFFPHLRDDEPGTGLSNFEYAPIFEEMAKLPWAPEVFNCNAPVTGNMELLGTATNEEQRQKWLRPLLEGEWQSCFAATEPQVASSDATNYETTISRDGEDYVVNGRKWFISWSMHPRCKFMILMGKTNPENSNRHKQHGVIIIPLDTPGVHILKDTTVMNAYHVGGHPEILLDNVRVPAENMLGEPGEGFAIMQKRMGPGRIHYGMRCVGMAEVALGLMMSRAKDRVAFGKHLYEHGSVANDIGRSRIEIDQARLLCMHTARMLDEKGPKGARKEISMLKIVGTELLQNVSERALRVHGAMGVSDQTPLAELYGLGMHLSIADGPSEVHLPGIAKMELRNYDPADFDKYYDIPAR
ncbi:MAG: acyl-CoA dehydrogenase family protein [Pseudomonadales bacterium]